jgi:RND family efflux transporter MFP subunit
MTRLSSILVFLALFLGVVLLLPQIQAATTKGATLKYDAKKTTLYTPRTESIADTLTLTGSIETDQIASLRFQNSGKLVWVGVKVGDRVKKGQAIASLDKAELRKNLATQFNNYRKSLSEFNDTQDKYKPEKDALLVTDTIQRILDRTQYSLDNSVINYELTDMSIKEATLISPIDGVVVALDQPFAGSNVTPATATFTIVNPNNLYFKSEIDQDIVTKVTIGQAATLELDSFPGEIVNSKINYIAFTPVSGQTSTVYEIRFDLPLKNDKLTYRLGMDGDVDIILSQADNTLTIPTDAVNDDNGQRFVYIKSDKELIRRDIKTGIENDITTQVIEGLAPDDQVAVTQK